MAFKGYRREEDSTSEILKKLMVNPPMLKIGNLRDLTKEKLTHSDQRFLENHIDSNFQIIFRLLNRDEEKRGKMLKNYGIDELTNPEDLAGEWIKLTKEFEGKQVEEGTLKGIVKRIYTNSMRDREFEKAQNIFRIAEENKIMDLKDKIIAHVKVPSVRSLESIDSDIENAKKELSAEEINEIKEAFKNQIKRHVPETYFSSRDIKTVKRLVAFQEKHNLLEHQELKEVFIKAIKEDDMWFGEGGAEYDPMVQFGKERNLLDVQDMIELYAKHQNYDSTLKEIQKVGSKKELRKALANVIIENMKENPRGLPINNLDFVTRIFEFAEENKVGVEEDVLSALEKEDQKNLEQIDENLKSYRIGGMHLWEHELGLDQFIEKVKKDAQKGLGSPDKKDFRRFKITSNDKEMTYLINIPHLAENIAENFSILSRAYIPKKEREEQEDEEEDAYFMYAIPELKKIVGVCTQAEDTAEIFDDLEKKLKEKVPGIQFQKPDLNDIFRLIIDQVLSGERKPTEVGKLVERTEKGIKRTHLDLLRRHVQYRKILSKAMKSKEKEIKKK